MFGVVGKGGQVRNVGVRRVLVSGYGSGSVVGGLVGVNRASIVACYETGVVYGGGESSIVGGLAGANTGRGKTTVELVTPTGYAGIYAIWNLDLDGGGTKDDPWDFGTASEYPMLRADFDGDVDADDINPQRRVVSPLAATTDFNGDGRTDFADFFKFIDAFGT